MTVNFFLKDKKKERTSIEAIIRYKGERYKIATGESVLSDYWNENKKRCREVRAFKDAGLINARLDKWERLISDALTFFASRMEVPTKEELKTKVLKLYNNNESGNVEQTFLEYAEEFIRSSDKSPSTIKKYVTTLNKLKEYEAFIRRPIFFKDINLEFYRNLKAWFDSKGYSKNYFGSIVKNIKVFMNESQEAGLHDFEGHKTRKFITEAETADSVYLSEEELLKIHNLVFTEELIREYYPEIRKQNLGRKMEALTATKNRFLIGAFTALRVSDFNRLGEINIQRNFIRIRTKKTGQDVVIPIHWVIKEILESDFDLERTVSSQKLNKNIKEVCQMAEICDPVTIHRTEGGKQIERTLEKWELVSTHTARRSGATNMYKAGIPTISIMRITGHQTERAFLKYIRISQEENAELLANHAFFKK